MTAHLNPYPLPSQPDANSYYRMFNYNTYTPFLLALYALLCKLPYALERLIYFAVDWLCIVYLFVRTRQWFPGSKRIWHWALFVLFVIADFGVRLHMERGQYYLEIAAAMAWNMGAWKDEESSGWSGAIALALLILVRPTFVLLLSSIVASTYASCGHANSTGRGSVGGRDTCRVWPATVAIVCQNRFPP
ncbi:MAG: DUF2029 domain-containing protein [Acidobacteriota bacterium]|nr:DUF2029 domain-containing protein [Acidobacteriota bacterium]